MDRSNANGITAASTKNALRYIFSTNGLPEEMVSVNGLQFTEQEMQDYLKSNGIQHYLSPSYHSATNREAERAVRAFKDGMKTLKDPASLAQKCARFLLGYCTTPLTATRTTLAEMLMGHRLHTQWDIIYPDLGKCMAEKSKRADHTVQCTLQVGEPVMVRDYRKGKKPWTYGVIQDKLQPVTYRVQVGELLRKRHTGQSRVLSSSLLSNQTTKMELPGDQIIVFDESIPLTSSAEHNMEKAVTEDVQPAQLTADHEETCNGTQTLPPQSSPAIDSKETPQAAIQASPTLKRYTT